jgi:hypothetical protein
MKIEKVEKKKRALVPDMSIARKGDLDMPGLRALAEKHPETFFARMEDLIAEGKLTLRMIPDLKALFRAFAFVNVEQRVDIAGEVRTILTSAFPLLMGNLVVAAINAAYDQVPTLGQELVTDMESNKKFTHIAKLHALTHQQYDTKEGDDFPLISASESYVVIGHRRKGFRYRLSQESLDEGPEGFALLIDQGGEIAADVIEEHTLKKVTDHDGSAAAGSDHVYRPGGVGTALYTTTAGAQTPLGTRLENNPLVDATDLDNLRELLAAALNTRGTRISIPMSVCKLLVPDALLGVADKILQSELTPGTVNEVNNWGPRGRHRPGSRSTSKLDDLSASAYYLGWFERQFVRKWKVRLETVSVYADPLEYLRSRTAWEGRLAWDVEIGARDNVYVYQSLAGATAPKDEA